MRCCFSLLLALCLCAAVARSQDDSSFCSAVVPDSPDSEWQWISDGTPMDIPEDILNATIQYFDEKYVPGVGTEGEKRNKYEQWVPCTDEDRSATGVGCIKQGDAADMYELRISIKCSHTDHVDEADVTLAVTVPNDGGDLNVTVTDVELNVDESHIELPKCVTQMCSECVPVEAVEGEVPAKEVCSACIAGYELGTDGECQRIGAPSASERKLLQTSGTMATCVPDDKACPCGQYFYTGTIEGGCGPCTRPGCAQGQMSRTQGVLTDCVYCYAYQGNCPQTGPGRNQWCRSCTYGYFWQDQGCNQCQDYIANCADCRACSTGASCHGGATCVQCMVGFKFRGDGTGFCVPV